jgi:hypothetical protein
MRFVTEPLDTHDRRAFSCGNARIDRFFRERVSQDVKRDYCKCFVMLESASGRLVGFYTLSANAVSLSELPEIQRKKLPRYPTVPVHLVGWLGRDLHFAAQSIGRMLLADAFIRADQSAAAAHAIVADAIDANAKAFYLHHHFRELDNGKLFLPMSEARRVLT